MRQILKKFILASLLLVKVLPLPALAQLDLDEVVDITVTVEWSLVPPDDFNLSVNSPNSQIALDWLEPISGPSSYDGFLLFFATQDALGSCPTAPAGGAVPSAIVTGSVSGKGIHQISIPNDQQWYKAVQYTPEDNAADLDDLDGIAVWPFEAGFVFADWGDYCVRIASGMGSAMSPTIAPNQGEKFTLGYDAPTDVHSDLNIYQTTATITWTPITANGPDYAHGYLIRYQKEGDTEWQTATVQGFDSDTYLLDTTGFTPGKYTVEVATYTAVGQSFFVPTAEDPSFEIIDHDQDDDGIPNENDPDVDGDGILNSADPDIDNDGLANADDSDMDGDGYPNTEDPDLDNDGLANFYDDDTDGDGDPNVTDPDDDGDGIPDASDPTPLGLGSTFDLDGDGLANAVDPDIDGDGLNNIYDDDMDGDGLTNDLDPDIDADGVLNAADPAPEGTATLANLDGDALPNQQDTNTDGDLMPNQSSLTEYDYDIDNDGLMNTHDNDIDGDGLENYLDADIDGDHLVNYYDNDQDGDGVANDVDNDIDGDGNINVLDTDPQGIGTRFDLDADGDENHTADTVDPDVDGDTIPNASDPDIDGDGILNADDETPYGDSRDDSLTPPGGGGGDDDDDDTGDDDDDDDDDDDTGDDTGDDDDDDDTGDDDDDDHGHEQEQEHGGDDDDDDDHPGQNQDQDHGDDDDDDDDDDHGHGHGAAPDEGGGSQVDTTTEDETETPTHRTGDDDDGNGLPDYWENLYFGHTGVDPNADPDGDGLTNRSEYLWGTDPTNPDTDGDELNDYQETHETATNPLRADTDRDGLSDSTEVVLGTDPTNPDTDGDTFNDSIEIKFGTDPLDPDSYPLDSDLDGVTDAWEIEYFENIDFNLYGDRDYDNDGLSDKYEYLIGTDPTNPDTDGDGYTDAEEVLDYGTDPLDPTSLPGASLTPRITNWEDGEHTSEKIPFFRGTGPASTEIHILAYQGETYQTIAQTTTDPKGKFIALSDREFEDGSYFFSAAAVSDHQVTAESKPIQIIFDSSLSALSPGAPVPDELGGVFLTEDIYLKDLTIEVDNARPTLRGRAPYGAQVYATWRSMIINSALLVDSESGAFAISPNRDLEEGDHTVMVYAEKNGLKSSVVRLPFTIKFAEPIHAAAPDWTPCWWWLLLLLLLAYAYYRYRRHRQAARAATTGKVNFILLDKDPEKPTTPDHSDHPATSQSTEPTDTAEDDLLEI